MCLVVAAFLILAGEGAAAIPGLGADWLSYGRNAQLTNYVAAPPGAPASPRGVVWTTKLDGAIYASPLAVGGVLTATGVHDLVIVATEAGSVYGVDAHDGSIVWRRTSPRVTTQGCGNWGITSTGAIDKARGVVYVVTADGYLHALKLSSGTDLPGWPTVFTTRPLAEYVWGGLRIVDSRVYIPIASYCDLPDPTEGLAEGRLVGVEAAAPSDQVVFDPVPGADNLGGIWGYGGVSTDAAGDVLYTGVGNSAVLDPSCNCVIEDAGYGADLVALSPDLARVDSASRPPYIPTVGDADFGASPLVFQPKGCPPLLAMNNKNGNLFVWDRLKIGNGPIARFGIADSFAAFIAEPSWSPLTQTMYDSHASVMRAGKVVGEGIDAIAVEPGCTFKPSWLTQTGSGVETPPLIVGDTVYDGAGDSPGIVALDAITGKLRWRFVSSGSGSTSAPLIETDGLIVAGDTAGVLRAFG